MDWRKQNDVRPLSRSIPSWASRTVLEEPLIFAGVATQAHCRPAVESDARKHPRLSTKPVLQKTNRHLMKIVICILYTQARLPRTTDNCFACPARRADSATRDSWTKSNSMNQKLNFGYCMPSCVFPIFKLRTTKSMRKWTKSSEIE